MVITRFAPSPTGYLHIGGLRTALFSYLWARKNGGRFLLRIEDTDLARNSQEAMRAIVEAFEWVGLDFDGEVVYQSARFDIYKEYIRKLLDDGKAYYCYMSKEELDILREELQAKGEKPKYDNRYRDFYGIPPEGIAPVVRIKAPLEGMVEFEDGVKGRIAIDVKELDDFIIARSDGTPTYNFVVAIDDALMNVSDVIRGDDHLSNTPKQIIIYNALGFELPMFYHVPMILNPDGKKLSKRDGATDVMDYKKEGYLPEALLNFLVRLGWSHGDQEIFDMKEMCELFCPKDINKSASAYNQEKLLWLNSHYIKNSSNDKLARELERYELFLASHDKKEILLNSVKDRAKTIKELAIVAKGILYEPNEYEQKSCEKFAKDDVISNLEGIKIHLVDSLKAFNLPIDYEELLHQYFEKKELKISKYFQPLRFALTGSPMGVSVFDIMSILGKNITIKRLESLIERLREEK